MDGSTQSSILPAIYLPRVATKHSKAAYEEPSSKSPSYQLLPTISPFYTVTMPAYHSIFLGDQGVQLIGNFPLLPLRTRTRGPAYTLPPLPSDADPNDVDPDSESYDILDEALSLFRANVFFRNFEIQGPADRHLIYSILFLSDCLSKLKPNMDNRAAEKFLINLSLEQFSLPGEPGFPLNQAFEGPRDRQDAEALRGYISQVRQELALRLHARLYEGGRTVPDKFWLSFAKRKFMGKSL